MTNKNRQSFLFSICLLIPVIILLSMLLKPVITLMKGEEVVLATVPIDPRDLLYGDYVTLDLEIKKLDTSLLSKSLYEKMTANNDFSFEDIPVYVGLEKGDKGIFYATSISESKLDGLYIQGKLFPHINHDDGIDNPKKSVNISYGIERYYLEEGTGMKLEEQSNRGKVLVSAKIHDGYPILTGIKGVEYAEQEAIMNTSFTGADEKEMLVVE